MSKTIKIEHRELVLQVATYSIEAETEEEAIDKYVNELAGAIEPDWVDYEERTEQSKDEIIIARNHD